MRPRFPTNPFSPSSTTPKIGIHDALNFGAHVLRDEKDTHNIIWDGLGNIFFNKTSLHAFERYLLFQLWILEIILD